MIYLLIDKSGKGFCIALRETGIVFRRKTVKFIKKSRPKDGGFFYGVSKSVSRVLS